MEEGYIIAQEKRNTIYDGAQSACVKIQLADNFRDALLNRIRDNEYRSHEF